LSHQTQDSDSAEFGPNQWLVDPLREQWREDPSSVDPSWAEYFSTQGPATADGSPAETSPEPASTTTSTGAPARSSDGSSQDAASATADPGGSTTPAPARSAPAQRTSDSSPSPPPAPTPAPPPSSQAAPTPAAQPSKDSSAVNADTSKTSTDSAASTQPAVSTTSDRPEKVPTTTAQIPAVELREPEVVKLRGPAAAVARNMDESLGVPTATSVRDVPVKLLFDNRLVINNHLKRHRAGKVSFTHLIGWAMIEAITEIPDMNNGF